MPNPSWKNLNHSKISQPLPNTSQPLRHNLNPSRKISTSLKYVYSSSTKNIITITVITSTIRTKAQTDQLPIYCCTIKTIEYHLISIVYDYVK